MNEIGNKFLSAADKFMLKCIQEIQDLHRVLVDHLQKSKKEYKNLKKQYIHDIFIKTN